MDILSIFKVLGNAISGAIELGKVLVAVLKSLGILLNKYEQDLKIAGEGIALDPEMEKNYFLKDNFLYKYLGKNTKRLVKRVVNFALSPSMLNALGIISIALMFFSPFGPVAAGIAASISLTILSGSFIYQTYKLRKNLIRKANLSLLHDIKEGKKEIAKGIENGTITPQIQQFYEQKVDPTDKNFEQAKSSKYALARGIVSDATANFLDTSVIVISSVLSFNIPSAVIGGIALLGTSIQKATRTAAELKSVQDLKNSVHNASNELKISTNTKTASVQNLHEKSLKQHAFKLTCQQFSNTENFSKDEFESTYSRNLEALKQKAPAPKITFTSAMKDNVVKGFSMHKGLEQHSPAISENNANISSIRSAVASIKGASLGSASKKQNTSYSKGNVKSRTAKPKKIPHSRTQDSFAGKLKKSRSKKKPVNIARK